MMPKRVRRASISDAASETLAKGTTKPKLSLISSDQVENLADAEKIIAPSLTKLPASLGALPLRSAKAQPPFFLRQRPPLLPLLTPSMQAKLKTAPLETKITQHHTITSVKALDEERTILDEISDTDHASLAPKQETDQAQKQAPNIKTAAPPLYEQTDHDHSLGVNDDTNLSISHDDFEKIELKLTRLETRLFWISVGISVGTSFGALGALLRFFSNGILSIDSFFQTVLFFSTLTLGVMVGLISMERQKQHALLRKKLKIAPRSLNF